MTSWNADEPRLEMAAEQRVILALAEAGVAFTNERQLGPVLDHLLVAALAVGEADEGSIMLFSADRQSLVVRAARGPRAELVLGKSQPVDPSIAGWVLRERRPLTVHGRTAPGEPQPVESGNPRPLTSAVVVRLETAGQVLGVMNVSCGLSGTRMDERTQVLLEVLARHAAIVIANVQMMEALRNKEERLEQLMDRLLRESGRADSPSTQLDQPLTKREQEVLELLVEGLTNREIGARLILEVDTVKGYVERIVKKLHAVDRTHAAAIAVRGGLVE